MGSCRGDDPTFGTPLISQGYTGACLPQRRCYDQVGSRNGEIWVEQNNVELKNTTRRHHVQRGHIFVCTEIRMEPERLALSRQIDLVEYTCCPDM